jgi:N-acetylglucosaminyldiphosphoundecaprenol N-acetyl-beta-D-mannosaminyltransferase
MAIPFGIRFSQMTLDDLVDQVVSAPIPPGESARLVATANLDHVVHLTRSASLRAAYSRAWVATADGTPVYLYARLRGCRLPGRVAGSDLIASLLPRLVPGAHRPFFLVSRPRTGVLLREYLISRGFPVETLVIECPPFGFEMSRQYSMALAERVRAHGTTHLILGVGAPKSEVWIDTHREDLGPCYAVAVGAGLDFFVGVERRAPRWMQRVGMEWFWRFAREPRRLFRRYFVDSWTFLFAVKRDLTGTQYGTS